MENLESKERKAIKFGNNLIDFSIVNSLSFSVNPLWKELRDENNSYFYNLTVHYADEITPKTYTGTKDDVYELLLYLDEIEFIDGSIIKNFKKFINNLKKQTNDYNAYIKLLGKDDKEGEDDLEDDEDD